MKPTDPPPPAPPEQDPARASSRRPSLHGGYRIGEGGHLAGPADPYDDGVAHHRAGVDDDLHNLDVDHEHKDVSIRAVIASAVIMVVVVLASLGLMAVMFGWLETQAAGNDPQVSPVAAPATQMPPTTTQSPFFNERVTGVQLLTNERMALEKYRAEQTKRLHGYGWADQKSGVAYMPIDEAKKLIVQRGLPVREGTAAPATLGTHLPAYGEASGGRAITVPLPPPPTGTPGQPTAQPHGTETHGAKPATKPH